MRHMLLPLLLLAAPRAAFACSVCFGQSDAPMAVATNAGIFVMLGITTSVLAVFAACLVRLLRRAERAVEALPGPVAGPQEGAARC